MKSIGFIAVAWAATIFATSCIFIERSIFVNFVKKYIPTGVPQQIWVTLWEGFGVFIVKAYHMAEFALLCCLLFQGITIYRIKNRQHALVIAAALSALYATSDEWHQTLVPGRGGTWVDVLIDCVGISLASVALSWHRKRSALKGCRSVTDRPKGFVR